MRTDQIRPLTQYHLRPKSGLDRYMEAVIQPDDYIAETDEAPGFLEALKVYKEAESRLPEIDEAVRDAEYPKIVFLGTGSSIPREARNVSAILIHLT